MTFIRPQARAAIWRWREVLIGGATIAIGTSWVLGPGGLLGWVGWPLIIAGLALAIVGLQRARFRAGSDGPGVVTVDEGQIAYFGPLTGGAIALSEVERLTLDPTAKPQHWILDQPGQPPLQIPINAKGADALFDVFATLPGLRTQHMLGALNGPGTHPVVIWERVPGRVMLQPLH